MSVSKWMQQALTEKPHTYLRKAITQNILNMKIQRETIELIGVEATITRERGKNKSLFLKIDGLNSCVEIGLDKEEVEALRELLNREDNQK